MSKRKPETKNPFLEDPIALESAMAVSSFCKFLGKVNRDTYQRLLSKAYDDKSFREFLQSYKGQEWTGLTQYSEQLPRLFDKTISELKCGFHGYGYCNDPKMSIRVLDLAFELHKSIALDLFCQRKREITSENIQDLLSSSVERDLFVSKCILKD